MVAVPMKTITAPLDCRHQRGPQRWIPRTGLIARLPLLYNSSQEKEVLSMRIRLVSVLVLVCLVTLAVVTTPRPVLSCDGTFCGCDSTLAACVESCQLEGNPPGCGQQCAREYGECAICCCCEPPYCPWWC
jgi:hypothetical protein